MTNFIPIFPLGIVVYPGEDLNLHIFEERYKQLINECFADNKAFGIPTVIDNKLMEYGTLVKVTEIYKVYDDGKMDIRTKGLDVFRMLEVIKDVPDKLYSGAIVNYPENSIYSINPNTIIKIIRQVRELHKLLNIDKQFQKADGELTAYDIAHHAGLSLEEEFELLKLTREDQRQEFLKRHLRKILHIVAGIDALKEKIKLNGHFRNLKGFEL